MAPGIPPHTHGLPKLVEVLAQQGVDASGLASLPLRTLTRITVTSRHPLADTPPMDLFEPTDSEQAIATATEKRETLRTLLPAHP